MVPLICARKTSVCDVCGGVLLSQRHVCMAHTRRRCGVVWPCAQSCDIRADRACPMDWADIGGGLCVVLHLCVMWRPGLRQRVHVLGSNQLQGAQGCLSARLVRTPKHSTHPQWGKVAGCKPIMGFHGWCAAVAFEKRLSPRAAMGVRSMSMKRRYAARCSLAWECSPDRASLPLPDGPVNNGECLEYDLSEAACPLQWVRQVLPPK